LGIGEFSCSWSELKDNAATGCRTCQAVREGVAAFEDHTPDDDQNLTAAAHVDVTRQRDKLQIKFCSAAGMRGLNSVRHHRLVSTFHRWKFSQAAALPRKNSHPSSVCILSLLFRHTYGCEANAGYFEVAKPSQLESSSVVAREPPLRLSNAENG
jgi:hypothetical protein